MTIDPKDFDHPHWGSEGTVDDLREKLELSERRRERAEHLLCDWWLWLNAPLGNRGAPPSVETMQFLGDNVEWVRLCDALT